MRTVAIAIGAAVAIAGAALWLVRTNPVDGPPREPVAVVARGDLALEPSTSDTAPPASLRDSEVDGALAQDGERFRPGRDALRLFDYFLSATGEEPPERIRARIVAEIGRRLPAAAAREAEAFLDRYLAYRAEAARMAADERLAESADLERRLQWLRELRRKHFGAELAAALFGEEEHAVEVALARRRVAADASLDENERRARLEALEKEQSESVRAVHESASLPLRLRQEERALRDAGASEAEIRAVREQTLGAEAAERLAQLDRDPAEWQLRVDAYRAERDDVATDPSLDPAARAARIEALRAQHFDEREQLRVRALDQAERY